MLVADRIGDGFRQAELERRSCSDAVVSSLELELCAVAQRCVLLHQNHGFPHMAQICDVRQVDRPGSVISPTVSTRYGGFVFAVRVTTLVRTKTRLLMNLWNSHPMSVPHGAGGASVERAQPLVETSLSLKIQLC